MLVLSYGYKKPQTGDRGALLFGYIEFDIQRLNDHDHDGVDSARLTATSCVAVTIAVPAAAWVDQGGGMYRQEVTIPAGLQYSECAFSFRETATGHIYMLAVEKKTESVFYVYCNDNTKTFTAVLTT